MYKQLMEGIFNLIALEYVSYEIMKSFFSDLKQPVLVSSFTMKVIITNKLIYIFAIELL